MELNSIADTRAERAEIETKLTEINEFVETSEFQKLLAEMRALPNGKPRHRFIRDQVINRRALVDRGIIIPEDMIIQRSIFMDGRPTLFCVTKYLSCGHKKVTITFDEGVPTSPK